jgi:hypothetical protein
MRQTGQVTGCLASPAGAGQEHSGKAGDEMTVRARAAGADTPLGDRILRRRIWAVFPQYFPVDSKTWLTHKALASGLDPGYH